MKERSPRRPPPPSRGSRVASVVPHRPPTARPGRPSRRTSTEVRVGPDPIAGPPSASPADWSVGTPPEELVSPGADRPLGPARFRLRRRRVGSAGIPYRASHRRNPPRAERGHGKSRTASDHPPDRQLCRWRVELRIGRDHLWGQGHPGQSSRPRGHRQQRTTSWLGSPGPAVRATGGCRSHLHRSPHPHRRVCRLATGTDGRHRGVTPDTGRDPVGIDGTAPDLRPGVLRVRVDDRRRAPATTATDRTARCRTGRSTPARTSLRTMGRHPGALPERRPGGRPGTRDRGRRDRRWAGSSGPGSTIR